MRILLLFCLSVFLAQNASAQGLLLSRSADRLRIDPRGGLPVWVNDPLPFIGHPVIPCVKDHERVADYYHWDENAGWVLEQTVVREYQPELNLIREFRKYHDDGWRSSESIFVMDRDERLMSSEIRAADPDGIVGITQREMKYSNGLLVNEDVYEISASAKRKISSLENILSFDGHGAVTNILSKSSMGDDEYNTVVYDLSYSGNRLKEIQQSSLEVLTGRIVPVFRYELTDSDETGTWHFTSMKSSLFNDEGWASLRTDSLSRNEKNEIQWTGSLNDSRHGSSTQTTRLLFDDKGNLTDFMQYSGRSTAGQPELIGHLRFEINYARDGVTPVSVTTSYLLPDKSYINSMKVNYSNGPTGSNGSLTVFPNPASEHCTVLIGQETEQDLNVLVTDSRGRVVLSQKTGMLKGRMFSMDTSSLASGTYQVQVIGMKSQASAKLVIVR